MAEGGGGCGRATRDVRKIERIQITGRGAEEGGRLARLMVEGVSDEVGSLGEESNAKEGGMEGKRVPREREWNQYVEAHTSVCLRSHMRVSVWPGEAKHASFHARGWIKAAASCLLSPLPSSYGSNPRGRTRVCARIRTRNSMVSNVIGISFLACLRGTSSLLKYREKLLSPAFSEKGRSWVIVGDHTAPSS